MSYVCRCYSQYNVIMPDSEDASLYVAYIFVITSQCYSSFPYSIDTCTHLAIRILFDIGINFISWNLFLDLLVELEKTQNHLSLSLCSAVMTQFIMKCPSVSLLRPRCYTSCALGVHGTLCILCFIICVLSFSNEQDRLANNMCMVTCEQVSVCASYFSSVNTGYTETETNGRPHLFGMILI